MDSVMWLMQSAAAIPPESPVYGPGTESLHMCHYTLNTRELIAMEKT